MRTGFCSSHDFALRRSIHDLILYSQDMCRWYMGLKHMCYLVFANALKIATFAILKDS